MSNEARVPGYARPPARDWRVIRPTSMRADQAVSLPQSHLTLIGRQPEVGQTAPDFMAVDAQLSPVLFSRFQGSPSVICSAVSVCDDECSGFVSRICEQLPALGGDTEVVVVSMDLPFSLNGWHAAEMTHRVTLLSDHRNAAFGIAYGLLIRELRLLANAVIVIDRSGILQYRAVSPQVTGTVDVNAAIEIAQTIC